ncbi:unnamed protein product [Penicillium roqueforti FM164]|uniref:Genomic scaffold, ProqFM164S01 n=1 Tax=Penicillium roqueforti (strain FM164) TaxID=1365484 RepID=W6PW13_PENRF|nr:unnamed protein product [Penicillium roqueforti FM164]
MDLSERYPPSMLLAEVAKKLHDHHSELRVSLTSNHPLCVEALAASLDCVYGIPERIFYQPRIHTDVQLYDKVPSKISVWRTTPPQH